MINFIKFSPLSNAFSIQAGGPDGRCLLIKSLYYTCFFLHPHMEATGPFSFAFASGRCDFALSKGSQAQLPLEPLCFTMPRGWTRARVSRSGPHSARRRPSARHRDGPAWPGASRGSSATVERPGVQPLGSSGSRRVSHTLAPPAREAQGPRGAEGRCQKRSRRVIVLVRLMNMHMRYKIKPLHKPRWNSQ